MIKYKDCIEKYFLIDEPKIGQLVPFIFNPVQQKYYQELISDYDIEEKGISSTSREVILKARREGFSSLIIALFAADDILQQNPTESLVISYRDDATDTFRKRYRIYITSYFARKSGYTVEQIQQNPSILDIMAKQYLSIDSSEMELAHNKAHFYCGTASARVGGRGGVVQKLLFSEAAFYPDTDKMTAKEIVDGTMRQVDVNSGWVFMESTANGYGNYYEQLESAANRGEHRFKSRFYGWDQFYTQEEFDVIKSEFIDKLMLKQEYPKTREEAYIASGSSYFDNEKIFELLKKVKDPIAKGSMYLTCQHDIRCKTLLACDNRKWEFKQEKDGKLFIWDYPQQYHSYVLGGDVAEGVDQDSSVGAVIDNKTMKTVAKFSSKLHAPDDFTLILYALGMWYNQAYAGIESNKDGLWVNSELFKMGYPNLYFREQLDDITHSVSRKIGFRTSEQTRPYILSELRKLLAENDEIWTNKDFLEECLVFVRSKVGRPEAMSGKHDDEIFATSIAYEIRRNAPQAFAVPSELPRTVESLIMQRLARLHPQESISQLDYS